MSIQALQWLFEDCPDLEPHLFATLAGVCNHADENGKGAHPSQELLSWYNRKNERSGRRDLEQLEELKLIRRGDQRRALYLPADKRPVVWDVAMELKRAPRPEAGKPGRPPRSAKDQVAEEKKNGRTPTSTGKKTRGRPRRNPVDVDVPPIEKRADVHVPPDVEVPPDVDVPRTSLGLALTGSLDLRATTSSEPQQQKPSDFPEIENQEDETTDTVMKPLVLPTLTPWEEAVLEECLPLAGRRWDRLSVRKVLGSRRIREITDRDPALVRRAFLIGAASNRGTTVTVPKRMWHTDWCPHWAEAERQLAAERVPHNQDPAGADLESVAGTSSPRFVARPSPSQESPFEDAPPLTRDEAVRMAAEKIAAGKAKIASTPDRRVGFEERMSEIDRVLAEVGSR